MRTAPLLALMFLSTLSAFSQDLFPTLYIDSLYQEEIEEVSFDGNHTYDVFYAGYSYEADTILQQIREPKRRINYQYSGDSVVTEIIEKLLSGGGWELERRKKNVYDDTLLLSTLIVTWEDGVWENNTFESYIYNPQGLDTIKLVRKWIDGAWKSHVRRERSYNPQGDLVAISFYSANASGAFQYAFGAIYTYDNAGNRISETLLTSSMSGIVPTLERSWSYDTQNQIDTFFQCDYANGFCEPTQLQSYSYGIDTIFRNSYDWFNDDWEFSGVEVFFEGPMVYSFEPDSIHTYLYNFELGVQNLIQREYFSYTELPDNRLYYLHEIETYNTDFGFWVKTLFEEKWYHLLPEEPNALSNPAASQQTFTLFPNPAPAGSSIQLNLPTNTEEVRIFDLLGRLVKQSRLQGNTSISIQTPPLSGSYWVAAYAGDQLISIQKLMVQD